MTADSLDISLAYVKSRKITLKTNKPIFSKKKISKVKIVGKNILKDNNTVEKLSSKEIVPKIIIIQLD